MGLPRRTCGLILYHPVFNEFHDAMESTEPFYADAATYDVIDFPICTGTRISELAQ